MRGALSGQVRQKHKAFCARWCLRRQRGQLVVVALSDQVSPPAKRPARGQGHPHEVIAQRDRMTEGVNATRRICGHRVGMREQDAAGPDRAAGQPFSDDAVAHRGGGVVTGAGRHGDAVRQSELLCDFLQHRAGPVWTLEDLREPAGRDLERLQDLARPRPRFEVEKQRAGRI